MKKGLTGHNWRDEVRGRALRNAIEPGVGHQLFAVLRCGHEGCKRVEEIKFRQLPGPEVIDRKFIQRGWSLDPPRCPTHVPGRTTQKGKDMAVTPTPAAISSQIKVFGLLGQHFDGDTGQFADGWSDEKIAQETGMARDLVVAYREEGFGKLKVPPEVAQLRADIQALEDLLDGAIAPIREELRGLKGKLAAIEKKFAA